MKVRVIFACESFTLGNPGERISPEFYKLARELTESRGAYLAVDSVQAGFRVRGVLSITDYPGFESLPPPDFESFSKALNGGQYPLSVLALSERAAKWHRPGIYGNTMTGNPRACDVASSVLESITPELRKNINSIGEFALRTFSELQKEYPTCIEKVTGSGLLYAVHLFEDMFSVTEDQPESKGGYPCAEKWLRMNGIGVIHGGDNALRFTPNFKFSEKEILLQAEVLKKYFNSYIGVAIYHSKNLRKDIICNDVSSTCYSSNSSPIVKD